MRIGIDADGVLTDMAAYYREYGSRFFGRELDNPKGYDVKEMFNCTDKEEFKFGLKYFVKYCKDWPPREGCAEVIARLNRDGHKLYEITARKFTTMNNPIGWYARGMFRKWLKQYKLKFEDIYFCSESNSPADKHEGCRKYSVDIMIDDKPEVAYYLAEKGIKVLLFDAPYNQEVSGKNIVRVKDWEEVYAYIAGRRI